MATVAKTRKQQQQAISKVEETAETDPLVEEDVITNDDLKDKIRYVYCNHICFHPRSSSSFLTFSVLFIRIETK